MIVKAHRDVRENALHKGAVTLGIVSCNFVARQVAREIA
jgi:hypothetical protein